MRARFVELFKVEPPVSCSRSLKSDAVSSRLSQQPLRSQCENMPGLDVADDPGVSPAKRAKTEPQPGEEVEGRPLLRFAKLSEHATTPSRGSTKAAGYDLYSAYDYTVASMDKVVVKTDIQIAVPHGCYGRVAPRSGLAVKHFIDVGVVSSWSRRRGLQGKRRRGAVQLQPGHLRSEKGRQNRSAGV